MKSVKPRKKPLPTELKQAKAPSQIDFLFEQGTRFLRLSEAETVQNKERLSLERKYANLLSERLSWRQWVTYVPNKGIPVFNWFKFKEGFSRHLVRTVAAEFALKKGDRIYDPFAGCGTTLLAAKELGLDAIGTDMLPVAVFATKAKTMVYPDGEALLDAVRQLFHAPYHEPVQPFPDIRIINLAFPENVQRQLLFFKEEIETFEEPFYSFLMLGLLSILETVSRTSKDGQFLRLVEKTLPDVRETLRAVLTSMISDLAKRKALKISGDGRTSVQLGDARELCLPKRFHGKIAAVITSPPYLNRYDYSRSYALELCMLNVKSHEDMVQVRHSLLRSHIESKAHQDKPVFLPALDEILRELEKKHLNNERIPIMIRGYFEDMNLVIGKLAHYLRPGGRIALVVGNAQFAGESVPTDVILSELAEQHGFTCDEIRVTRYKGNSSQQMAVYGRRPVRESILFWRKHG